MTRPRTSRHSSAKSALLSSAQVIKALGGTASVMTLTGVTTPQAITNWRRSGKFPALYYVIMTQALSDKGYSAPDSLWSQKSIDDAA